MRGFEEVERVVSRWSLQRAIRVARLSSHVFLACGRWCSSNTMLVLGLPSGTWLVPVWNHDHVDLPPWLFPRRIVRYYPLVGLLPGPWWVLSASSFSAVLSVWTIKLDNPKNCPKLRSANVLRLLLPVSPNATFFASLHNSNSRL